MKIICCFLFFISLHTISTSQNIKQFYKDQVSLRNINYLAIAIDTADKYEAAHRLPFKGIVINDMRYDTSCMGIYAYLNVLNVFENKKINFKKGLAAELNLYLNHFYDRDTQTINSELVFFIKKFYIKQRDTIVENNLGKENIAQTICEVDCFFKKEEYYYPAFKLDTVIIERVVVLRKDIGEEINKNLIDPFLHALTGKINMLNFEKILSKNSYKKEDVYEKYKSRFNIGILTDLQYKKGIYANFNEFKNNAPSITEFTARQGKYRRVSLIDKQGNYINTINIFGFSDGKQCWIQHGNFCYPLIKTGNSFEFFYTTDWDNRSVRYKFLLTLMMETGEVN